MNLRPALTDLSAFAAIVAHRSFRKAADELGLSPSTLSHMMRTLETRMGVRLLHRTTRSVAPTEAGERLVARLQPLLRELDQALDDVGSLAHGPSGTLRINANETAVRLLLQRVVPVFLQRHPAMALDLVSEGRLVDIVAAGFDAGMRLGEALPQDMIAVPFGGPQRFIAAAAPAYLALHPPPRTPDELARHTCIGFRLPSGKPYRWEFARHGQELAVEVGGPLTLDHLGLMADAAVAGMGIAYLSEVAVQAQLDSGALVRVLDDWCPPLVTRRSAGAGARPCLSATPATPRRPAAPRPRRSGAPAGAR